MRVTRDEVRMLMATKSRMPLSGAGVQVRPTDEQASQVLDSLIRQSMKADTNVDGVITLLEMREEAMSSMVKRDAAFLREKQVPLGLASAHGNVTLADYNSAIDVVLAEIDVDGNGLIPIDEAWDYLKRLEPIASALHEERDRESRRARMLADAAACGPPKAPKDALIAFVGADEGIALSSVSIRDDSEEITAVQIDIQEGEQPLYVVLNSGRHMIWQFTGATGRVVQVVALSGSQETTPRSGVTGIEKTRVLIKPAQGCLAQHATDKDPKSLREAIKTALGRYPDVMTSRSKLSRVGLPLGRTSETEPYAKTLPPPASKAARAVYDEALRFYPFGVSDIDPAAVVAAAPVQRYQTLPSNLGIAYLIEKGVIEVSGYAQAMEIGKTTVIGNATVEGVDPKKMRARRVPYRYRIVGPMTFPAGLHGAHSASFVVAKGVRMPDGNPGHSTVVCEVSEASLLPGEMCR